MSVIFLAGGLLSLPMLPRLWTHRTTFYDKPGAWWPYSDAAWRGWIRGMPAGVVGGVLMGVGAVIGSFTGKFEEGGQDKFSDFTTSGLVVFVLGMAAFLAALVATAAVYLNRPKWVVPRHLRQGLGLIAEWRTERDRRT